MTLLEFFQWLNSSVFVVPSILLFGGAAILLTIKTGFLQLRGIPKFFSLISNGVKRKKHQEEAEFGTIDSIHALFTAMATTIGIGNVVSPSIAIMIGGPGALFWLVLYIILGSAIKYTEVVFALHTRIKTAEGNIIGGPMQYLSLVSSWLATWYGCAMAILMAGWSAVQSNTLSSMLVHESIPAWFTGLSLSLFVFVVLKGGAKRVGDVASKLVPVMCIGYITFALFILFKNPTELLNAFKLIGKSIFTSRAATGGFLGVTMLQALRVGIYRGIFITESGLGTSSIAHSMSDAQRATDQGILAMFSAGADAFLSLLSGLIVLVTGVWMQGEIRSTLVYESFKMHSPLLGRWILAISIALFTLTTVMGNSFNGSQSFASLTKFRWVNLYILFTVFIIFVGALMHVRLIWEIMDTILTFVAIPNLIGILYLAFKKPEILKD